VLAQANRLKKNKDIKKILKRGRRFSEDFLVMKILSNGLNESRFAFIVSQKFSKKAVERNKIRRQLSETVRQHLDKIEKGIDVIVLTTPTDKEKAVKEAKLVLGKLLGKANLITDFDK